MRRIAVLISLLILIVLLQPETTPTCASDADSLLRLIRNARGDNIQTSLILTDIAERRAREISVEFTHEGAGHPYAEILAWNSYPEDLTEAVAVKQWLDSPGHRAVLLGDYNRIGVGAFDSGPSHYYAAIFGNRPEPITGSNPTAPPTDAIGC